MSKPMLHLVTTTLDDLRLTEIAYKSAILSAPKPHGPIVEGWKRLRDRAHVLVQKLADYEKQYGPKRA